MKALQDENDEFSLRWRKAREAAAAGPDDFQRAFAELEARLEAAVKVLESRCEGHATGCRCDLCAALRELKY